MIDFDIEDVDVDVEEEDDLDDVDNGAVYLNQSYKMTTEGHYIRTNSKKDGRLGFYCDTASIDD